MWPWAGEVYKISISAAWFFQLSMCVLVGTAACIFQSCLFGLGVRRTFSHGQFVRAYGFTGQPGGGHDPGGPLEGQRPHALLGGGLLWECHLLAPSAGGLQREVPWL